MNALSSMRKFKKDFPKAARDAEYASCISIFYHGKAFWLNNEIQLTGWETGEDGKILSHDDIENIALKRIKEFKDAKAALEKESLVTRFDRMIKEAEKLVGKFHHYTTYRNAGGDKATICHDGDLWINLTGVDYQFTATGKKNRKEAIAEVIKIFEAYTGAVYDSQQTS